VRVLRAACCVCMHMSVRARPQGAYHRLVACERVRMALGAGERGAWEWVSGRESITLKVAAPGTYRLRYFIGACGFHARSVRVRVRLARACGSEREHGACISPAPDALALVRCARS
jgi:hypothetical protein